MEVNIKYVVYEYRTIMNNKEHLALNKVEFESLYCNSFETKEEAVKALVEHDMCYQNYVIMEEYYLTDYES